MRDRPMIQYAIYKNTYVTARCQCPIRRQRWSSGVSSGPCGMIDQPSLRINAEGYNEGIHSAYGEACLLPEWRVVKVGMYFEHEPIVGWKTYFELQKLHNEIEKIFS